MVFLNVVSVTFLGDIAAASIQAQVANLYNPVASDASGGRLTQITFNGQTASAQQGELGLMQVQHTGVTGDFSSSMTLWINSGILLVS